MFALKDIISHNDIIQDFSGFFKYQAENQRFVYNKGNADVQIAILRALEGYWMEKTGITITKRKDGRYVGKFIAEYADNGKAQYHYVYGKTYEEAESKVLIGLSLIHISEPTRP